MTLGIPFIYVHIRLHRGWFLHFSALGDAINKLSSNTNPSAQLLKSKLQAQVELQRTVSLTSRIESKSDPHWHHLIAGSEVSTENSVCLLWSPVSLLPSWSYILYRVLEVLQGVEKLGGYAGYKKYIEIPQGQKPAVAAAATPSDSDWDDCYASGWIASALVYTAVVLYADNHTGGGGSWGAGLGVGNLEGNLSHASWSTLCSAENDFYVQSIAGGVGMEFYIDGTYVAQFVGANLGVLVAAGFNGWMDWKWVPEV